MMINKRLIGTVAESKKYIVGNVILQWCSLAANIALMLSISRMLAELFRGSASAQLLTITGIVVLLALAVRFFCSIGAAKMGYFSSKAVKKTLREKIYQKLLRLGNSYSEQVKTSEVVQVAVEGVDQLETYFGAYLPQFFYAMLAPLTLFVVLCFVNVPAAVVLLICVPLIPVAIAAVQTWAKKLLSKYWGQYTELGDKMCIRDSLSMANRGFENPCEVIVKDHEGLVYLAVKTVSAQSMSSKNKMEGRIQKLQYLYDGEFRDGGIDGRYVFFPVTALRFISMGKGRDTLLHGSVCLKMQCSVGDMHMPESTAAVSYTHLDVYKRQVQRAIP